VQEFNRGVFNYLIATDESGLEGIEKDSDDEESDTEEPACESELPHLFRLSYADLASFRSDLDSGPRNTWRNRRG